MYNTLLARPFGRAFLCIDVKLVLGGLRYGYGYVTREQYERVFEIYITKKYA